MMKSPEPIVRVSRPKLKPEEREARLNDVKKAVSDLYIACVRNGIEWPAGRKEL